MNPWKCAITDDPVTLNVNLFIYRNGFKDNRVEVLTQGADGLMNIKEQGVMESTTPFMTLSYIMAKEILASLSEALDNKGIKPDSNAKIEGTLKATNAHLEDLRTLLKLRK